MNIPGRVSFCKFISYISNNLKIKTLHWLQIKLKMISVFYVLQMDEIKQMFQIILWMNEKDDMNHLQSRLSIFFAYVCQNEKIDNCFPRSNSNGNYCN